MKLAAWEVLVVAAFAAGLVFLVFSFFSPPTRQVWNGMECVQWKLDGSSYRSMRWKCTDMVPVEK